MKKIFIILCCLLLSGCYNYIELDEEQVIRITYREWSEKRNKFRVGTDFVDDDNAQGVITFVKVIENALVAGEDCVDILLKERNGRSVCEAEYQ